MNRRGCGCIGAIVGIVVLVVWFVIALTTEPNPAALNGTAGLLATIIEGLLLPPRWIAAALGF